MASNILKLSFGSILISVLFACTGTPEKGSVKHQPSTIKKDTCELRSYIGDNIDLKVGCSGCHGPWDKRTYPNVPTFSEISAIDSLRLVTFIFKTKHKGYYLKEPMLRDHGNKKLDSLDDCQKRNLVHFIKNYNRKIPEVLNVPK